MTTPVRLGRVVVVAGEALIDRVRDTSGAEHDVPGGGPFNTARALARLGAQAAFLGRLSDDAEGRMLRRSLVDDGVDVTLVSTGPEPTPFAFAELDAFGRAAYRFEIAGTAAAALTSDMVPVFGDGVEALHVGSLGLAAEPVATTLARLVDRERGRRAIVLDPNVRPGFADAARHRERLRAVAAAATIVKASDSDLAFMEPGLEVHQAAERLLERGARMVVVTLGERGAIALHGGVVVEVPAMRVAVVDTVGAGDVFGAALLAWLHRRGLSADLDLDERSLDEAVRHACVAASVACAHAGAYAPTADEVAMAEKASGV